MIERHKLKNGETMSIVRGVEKTIRDNILTNRRINITELSVISVINEDENNNLLFQQNYLLTKKTQQNLNLHNEIYIKTDLEFEYFFMSEGGGYQKLKEITSSLKESEVIDYLYFDDISDLWDKFIQDEKTI